MGFIIAEGAVAEMRQLFHPGGEKRLAISVESVYNILVTRLIWEYGKHFQKEFKKSVDMKLKMTYTIGVANKGRINPR